MSRYPKWNFFCFAFLLSYIETSSQNVNETIALTNTSIYNTIIQDKDDAAIYEMDNLKQHLENAKLRSNAYEAKLNNTLRYLQVGQHEAADMKYMYFANTSMDLMQQSIYTTRDRLQETRKFRQIFADDPPYRAAMIYVTLQQLKIKMYNIFTTMRNMKSDNNFIHVFILYERMIVANVDVETLVNQLFEMQETYKNMLHKKRDFQ